MTTYISLALSDTMFSSDAVAPRRTPLTPELVKARMASVQVASLVNKSHATTIDAIRRRFGIDVPLPQGEALPTALLAPGDELFVIQAKLPRIAEGSVHSQATVDSASISFARWRVPVRVDVQPDIDIPQAVFNEIIDDAYAIALWQRGATQLKTIKELKDNFDGEVAELAAVSAAIHAKDLFLSESQEALELFLDTYLEAADVLYYALCHRYVAATQHSELLNEDERPLTSHELLYKTRSVLRSNAVSWHTAIDAMLLKYARRASGQPKDNDAERRLIAPLMGRTEALYS